MDWEFDGRGWIVYLLAPEREGFRGGTLQEALAWCLGWLMVEEFSGGMLAERPTPQMAQESVRARFSASNRARTSSSGTAPGSGPSQP